MSLISHSPQQFQGKNKGNWLHDIREVWTSYIIFKPNKMLVLKSHILVTLILVTVDVVIKVRL